MIRPKLKTQTQLIILGAGRQGRNILDVCSELGITVIGFLDDTKPPGHRVNEVRVLGGLDKWNDLASESDCQFIVGIGWNKARREISTRLESGGATLATVIHPSCQISRFASIGTGVFISAFSRVLANAKIHRYCLIEGHSTLGADSVVGEGVVAGSGVTLTGGAQVGAGTFLGSGSVILGPARIGNESIIAANATVIRDIPDRALAAGTPAAIKKRLDAPPGPP
jgi:sugar O-acyltransferase (sialic acid O-acetyltransferase NeuD family)